jgi:tetratricopeptide (TPR) repeat protein
MAHENKHDDSVLKVEETLSKAELFIEMHQKNIAIVIGAIVVVVGGYLGYKNFYAAPREKQAQAQMFGAQQYFEKDSFKLALKGDGNNPGFLTVIDEFGGTKAGNLAHYYAGICYLKTGQFQQAIDNLESFSADDEFVAPIALGATGDCYMELGKTDQAIDYYNKASKKSENEMTTPLYLMKAGIASEIKGDFKTALENYNTIKEKYKKSQQATEIDKYIARAELKTK